MFVQELEGSLAVNCMPAGEILDGATIADAKLGVVEVKDLGELRSDGLIGRDAVEVAALDHERPWRNQRRQLGVVESAPPVEREDLVFLGPNEAVRARRRSVLPNTIVEVRRADRQ